MDPVTERVPEPVHQPQSNKIKIVLLGDTAAGKTGLTAAFTTNTYSANNEPTVLDRYDADRKFTIQGKVITLSVEIHDSSGENSYQKSELRKVCYAGADLFIMCIAADMP